LPFTASRRFTTLADLKMTRPKFLDGTVSLSSWQRMPVWVRFGLIPLLIIGVIAGGYYFYTSRTAAAPDAAKDGTKTAAPKAGAPGKGGRGGFDPNRVQPVIAVPARVADINVVQTALGTVAALKIATVKARTDGLLQDVFFREGQVVRAGEVLAQIDPAPLQVALSQVEGQLARDTAQLNNAKLDLERYRTLLAQDSIAKQQLDAQESLVRQFEGTVKVDRALVDNAKLQLSYTKVTAPIPGRLGLRQVDPGNIVRSSDAAGLVVITQIDPITVVFTIPQDNLQRVLKQLKAGEKLGVEAWDREQKNKLASGFLISTDNQIDTATGTIKLKAQFPNPDGLLFPNQFVNVRMVVDTRKGATVIPLAAIQRGAQGNIVYVVKEDKTTTVRPVRIGPSENDNVVIESGIAPGDVVVTDGVDRLREGAKVEVTAPFVPKARARGGRGGPGGLGGPGGAGKGEGKPDGKAEGKPEVKGESKAESKPQGKPADASDPRPAGKPGSATSSTPAKVEVPAAAGAAGREGKAGGWGELTDEQKAERRKRFEGMTDEQKAEFRKKMREQRGQQQ
jgi:membrane fusion protein, multidrug efflux system